MLYRPSFCSHCGEKIERAEWPLVASRRFCDVCARENRLTEWLPRVVVSVAVALGAAGLFGLFRASPPVENRAAQPDVLTLAGTGTKRAAGDFDTTPPRIQQSQPSSNSSQPIQVANSTSEPVKEPAISKNPAPDYYCGAATKKGTPCRRKVKRPGERCWQHRGMPSISGGTPGLSR